MSKPHPPRFGLIDPPRWVDSKECHAHMDGDCYWKRCPQIRDGEPQTSGRHCPYDTRSNDDG